MRDGTPPDAFARLMASLRACYPQRLDPTQWRLTIPAYYDRLGHQRPDVLRGVFDAAVEEHPDFFPTAGQLLRLIKRTGRRSDPHSTPMVRTERMESIGKHEVRRILDALGERSRGEDNN